MPDRITIDQSALTAELDTIELRLAALEVAQSALDARVTALETAGPVLPMRRAWFYKPTSDGTPASTIAPLDRIILTKNDETFRDSLKAAGSGPVLQYVLAAEVEGPGPYASSSATCDAAYDPHSNQLAEPVGSFCAVVHDEEHWFLHNGAGERLYDDTNPARLKYFMNPGKTDFQFWARSVMDGWLNDPAVGYDGIFLDNVMLNTSKISREAANWDGTIAEYPSEAAFRSAWEAYLAYLAQTISPLGANMIEHGNDATAWNSLLPYLDVVMLEDFATGFSTSTLRDATIWEQHLQMIEGAQSAGVEVLAVSQGNDGDSARVTYCLASFLLVGDGRSTFRYTNYNGQYTKFWNDPVHAVAAGLGAATSGRYQSGSEWVRDFESGQVRVDPVAQTATIG